MAAFRDDVALVEGVDEDWDEKTTGNQIMRPEWDFSPIRMRTMHHLPHIFLDTLRPERPDCPVLVPSTQTGTRTSATQVLFGAPGVTSSQKSGSAVPTNLRRKSLLLLRHLARRTKHQNRR